MSKFILHIDADAFFVSCEIIACPHLKNKPVATGQERGIISSLNYLAKSWGVKRGMPIWQAKKACPQLEILVAQESNYLKYSQRMFNIIQQNCDLVEKYSVDECFASINSANQAWKIKKDLELKLGISFSCGIANTKTLAKIASKLSKPAGFIFIDENNRKQILKKVKIEDVWNIGKKTSIYLKNLGVYKAGQFISLDYNYWQKKLAKNYLEVYLELQGKKIYHLIKQVSLPKSVSRTKTFHPKSSNASYLLSQLSLNLEKACYTLRSLNLLSTDIYFFLKDSNLNSYPCQFKLTKATNFPSKIMLEIEKRFYLIYSSKLDYRSTGIILKDLNKKENSLFSNLETTNSLEKIFKAKDVLNKKLGFNSLFLASSLKSVTKATEKDLNLPFLGYLKD